MDFSLLSIVIMSNLSYDNLLTVCLSKYNLAANCQKCKQNY